MKERLVDDTKDLARGAVLRCKGRTDRENLADLMVVLWRADEGHGHALVSVSGRDAGRFTGRIASTISERHSTSRETDGSFD
jgi:hypothetical protein